jgi:hypothetical protein
MEQRPEYAIAGTYRDYMVWKPTYPAPVSFLTRERAEQFLAAGVPKGKLHRLAGWETSDARELAERLEA